MELAVTREAVKIILNLTGEWCENGGECWHMLSRIV